MFKDTSERKSETLSDAAEPVALEDDELASVTGGSGKDRSGSGSGTVSGVIAGVDWV